MAGTMVSGHAMTAFPRECACWREMRAPRGMAGKQVERSSHWLEERRRKRCVAGKRTIWAGMEGVFTWKKRREEESRGMIVVRRSLQEEKKRMSSEWADERSSAQWGSEQSTRKECDEDPRREMNKWLGVTWPMETMRPITPTIHETTDGYNLVFADDSRAEGFERIGTREKDSFHTV